MPPLTGGETESQKGEGAVLVIRLYLIVRGPHSGWFGNVQKVFGAFRTALNRMATQEDSKGRDGQSYDIPVSWGVQVAEGTVMPHLRELGGLGEDAEAGGDG